jgi:hypothetical protein
MIVMRKNGHGGMMNGLIIKKGTNSAIPSS